MTDKSKPSPLKPQNNADRLLKHLKADSPGAATGEGV